MRDRFGTIVVGVDASEESDAALAWAQAHAGDDGGIIAVHAWHIAVMGGPDAQFMAPLDDAESLATAGLQERVDRADDDRIVPVVRSGHAGRALVDEARRRAADVIVVGHRGTSRLSMLLGSTANYVLHHAEHPVVICRAGTPPDSRRILVGVDDVGGGPQPADLVRWAAAVPGAEHVTVLHSWFLPPIVVGQMPGGGPQFHDDMDTAALEVAQAAIDDAGPPPDRVIVEARSARGPAGGSLIHRGAGNDLIVVGSRGRGGFTGLLLGSTSAEVAAHATVPVAVVP